MFFHEHNFTLHLVKLIVLTLKQEEINQKSALNTTVSSKYNYGNN